VEIILPLPGDATTPVTRCSQGNALYAPEKSALVWQIKNFPGGKEYLLRWVTRVTCMVGLGGAG
jgi:AP-1 complex subunit mu